ncbi:cytoplasmic protein [Shewanella cyperi]|uniref:Cytoplasmic protein n=1 Tax=Shewanella cyperi TaxID=2814292 RepID=A0A974XLK4_9GAMM|nr:cytoplasmic protein [Shewanella cyperi]QSX30569.1 cytoplasmic protein [Shewanella cyperi]QSX41349.1 cytoplasmic protein [Shewanella cyperi]
MAITVNSANISPNLANGSIGVKVAQLAKGQQEAEGQIAIDLINAASAPAKSAPVGNTGHNIDTTA